MGVQLVLEPAQAMFQLRLQLGEFRFLRVHLVGVGLQLGQPCLQAHNDAGGIAGGARAATLELRLDFGFGVAQVALQLLRMLLRVDASRLGRGMPVAGVVQAFVHATDLVVEQALGAVAEHGIAEALDVVLDGLEQLAPRKRHPCGSVTARR